MSIKVIFKKTEEEINSVCYIELSSEEIAINEETKFWLKELHLKDPDKVVLQNTGKWLNDTIINASMKIYKKQFPQIGSMQPHARLLFHSYMVHRK